MMTQSEVNSSGMPSNIDQNKADAQTNKNDTGNPQGNSGHTFPNLGRQSSIYSLTLDEFQYTLCENGKNFGSMNMDEFLSSIWTAEENQAHHHHHDNSTPMTAVGGTASGSNEGMIAKQPSLPRQGSLTLPARLCRKTVDEVWTEIQRTQQHPTQKHSSNPESNSNSNTQRQPTFGEMTLEDFLVKAGVVREPSAHPAQKHHPPYSFSPSQFVTRPMMGMTAAGRYPAIGGDTSGFPANGKRSNNGYPDANVPPSVACYPGRVTNGGPSSASACGVGLSLVSPVSPDEMVDNSAAHYGLDMAALRGKKRIIDGPVEKVVERRQRRMIKNRESAARSRARKQAYTVELEAELNQLREENTQLKHALGEMERQRKQKYREEQKQAAAVGSSRSDRALQKLKEVRRIQSCCLEDHRLELVRP